MVGFRIPTVVRAQASNESSLQLPVEMRDGDDFSTDVVVESVDAVGVDEAVASPQTGLDTFLNFTQNIESCFDSVFGYVFFRFAGTE